MPLPYISRKVSIHGVVKTLYILVPRLRAVSEIILEGGWKANICPKVRGILDFYCPKGGGSSQSFCLMEGAFKTLRKWSAGSYQPQFETTRYGE